MSYQDSPASGQGARNAAPGLLRRARCGMRLTAGLLTVCAISASAVRGGEIPVAEAESVGMSTQGLQQIDAAMQRHIYAGRIQVRGRPAGRRPHHRSRLRHALRGAHANPGIRSAGDERTRTSRCRHRSCRDGSSFGMSTCRSGTVRRPPAACGARRGTISASSRCSPTAANSPVAGCSARNPSR